MSVSSSTPKSSCLLDFLGCTLQTEISISFDFFMLHLFITCGVRKPHPLSCPDFTEIKFARYFEKQDWKRENHAKLEPLRGRGHLAANHCDQIHLKSM